MSKSVSKYGNNKRHKGTRPVLADCPLCHSAVNVGKSPHMGQAVTCPGCRAVLEIVWMAPIELDLPYENDEYDEFEEYDDYENGSEYGDWDKG